ncbi:type II secretion system F family protein [Ruficoccus amylovorans]|uniref:General secretion pathway protein F n=1 Tax=Ruficoccus amylovorans TaxID=1804625 RepID=A0A842HCT4_9BACT|nr:type II secretion system F family protein [Ruficoccus amylovorans]MBC2593201.1 type II secretion system F family protein [Ruficoccus amylovorans]
MPKFNYTAIDASGKQKTGKIVANSEDEANSKLSASGLMVSKLSVATGGPARKGPTGKAAAKPKKASGINFGKAINEEGLTIFTRQLATLLQAGLPLLRSLEVMIRQEKNPRFRDILSAIADNVRSGNNLSDGLAQHPKVFEPIYINMIRAGEAGGVLDVVLSRLARFMEKNLKTKKKVKSAMIYPLVVVAVAVIIVALLLIFIVPRFQKIFSDMLGGAELPLLTQIVINISNVITPKSFLSAGIMVGVIIALVVGFRYVVKTGPGRKIIDWLALNTPKIGELSSKAAVSRFTRTFGTLLSSGVPILQALQITRDIIGNSILSNALDRVHDRVRDGEPLAAPLEQQRVFPTMVTSMIDVGEETGELPEMLNRIADNYDDDVDNAVNSITSIIEPIMIVMLALVVGTIVIALFLPIIEIIKQLTS